MKMIERLAREIAERDFELELSPPESIEEMREVIGQLVLGAYPAARKLLGEEIQALAEAQAQTEVYSPTQRAALAYNLQRAAEGEINLIPSFLRLCAQAISGPTERELNLDAVLHSSDMDVVLVFAEEAGKDAAPVAARDLRERRART